MIQQSEVVEKREQHAVRASHAKSSACVVGTLTIADDLPPELAQGLFAAAGTYDVAIRFAEGPGETLGDRVSTHRGMTIKVFGVEGEKLPGHDAPTQDFVLATGRTFPSGTASGFLSDAKKIGTATPLPEGVKSAVSSMARNFNKVLSVFNTAYAKADFFGHPFSHPVGNDYFSQAPMRYGDYVAKLSAVPASQAQDALGEWQLDPHEDEDGFRHAPTNYFRDHEAVFELKVQLWANAETQPIEDALVEWPSQGKQHRTSATVRSPAQEAYSSARASYFDEVMTFRPAHSLAAHRPLGSVMRARLQVYHALSPFATARTGLLKKTPLTSQPSRPKPKQEAPIMSTAVNSATYAAMPIGTVPTKLTINGETRTRAIEPWTTLLDLLREGEDLIGTKKGCDHGQCGACTVLVDGRRINSCLKLAVTLDGAEITTIEGLGQPGNLHPLQSAFCDHDAFQCGYCTPGQICSAQGLINEGKARTRDEVRELMSGNLCRCGAYTNIIDAVLDVIGEQA